MKRNIFLHIRIGLFFILFSVVMSCSIFAGPYLGVELNLNKNEFVVGESINGAVIVTSFRPKTFSATFLVKIYKEDQLFQQSFVNRPVFQGTTEVELKNFGLKNLIDGLQDAGLWRIEIEKNDDAAVLMVKEILILDQQ